MKEGPEGARGRVGSKRVREMSRGMGTPGDQGWVLEGTKRIIGAWGSDSERGTGGRQRVKYGGSEDRGFK